MKTIEEEFRAKQKRLAQLTQEELNELYNLVKSTHEVEEQIFTTEFLRLEYRASRHADLVNEACCVFQEIGDLLERRSIGGGLIALTHMMLLMCTEPEIKDMLKPIDGNTKSDDLNYIG